MPSSSSTEHVLHHQALRALDVTRLSHRIASVIAPIICHFAAAVEDKAKSDGIDVLWFMARDGYLPMKVYEIVRGCDAPSARYLCVSRKSVSAASSPVYGLREAFLAQWNGENARLATLLSPVGLNTAELSEIAARYGFTSVDEEVDFRSDPRFHALCSDSLIQGRIATVSSRAHDDLLAYLSSCGFLSRHSAGVVDVGWAGQIQEAIQIVVSGRDDAPSIKGYYIALRDLGGMRRLAGVASEGLLFDSGEPDWRGQSILSCVDTFEDSCRALHGTVLGYKEGQPVFAAGTASRQVELADEPRLSLLHDAIILYARAWAAARISLGVSLNDTRETALAACVSLCRFPTPEQAAFFTTIGHSLDFGSGVDVGSRHEKKTGLVASIRRARAARWKEGSIASSPLRLPFQTAIFLLRRRQAAAAIPKPHAESDAVISRRDAPVSMPPVIQPLVSHGEKVSESATKGKFYRPGAAAERLAVSIIGFAAR
jgi:hypothetical protein